MHLRRHLVHPELDDRHVRRGRLEHVVQRRCATAPAAPARAPRIRGGNRRTSGRPCVRAPARTPSIRRRARPAPRTASSAMRSRSPALHVAQPIPPHAVHQVKQAPAFERLGHERVVHPRILLRAPGPEPSGAAGFLFVSRVRLVEPGRGGHGRPIQTVPHVRIAVGRGRTSGTRD